MHDSFLRNISDALDDAQREVNLASGGSIPTGGRTWRLPTSGIDQLTLLCATMPRRVMKEKAGGAG